MPVKKGKRLLINMDAVDSLKDMEEYSDDDDDSLDDDIKIKEENISGEEDDDINKLNVCDDGADLPEEIILKIKERMNKLTAQNLILKRIADLTVQDIQALSDDILNVKMHENHVELRFKNKQVAEENYISLQGKQIKGESLEISRAETTVLPPIIKNELRVAGLPKKAKIADLATLFPNACKISFGRRGSYPSAIYENEEDVRKDFLAAEDVDVRGSKVIVIYGCTIYLQKKKKKSSSGKPKGWHKKLAKERRALRRGFRGSNQGKRGLPMEGFRADFGSQRGEFRGEYGFQRGGSRGEHGFQRGGFRGGYGFQTGGFAGSFQGNYGSPWGEFVGSIQENHGSAWGGFGHPSHGNHDPPWGGSSHSYQGNRGSPRGGFRGNYGSSWVSF